MSSPRIQIALRQPPTKEEEEEEADGEEEYDSPSKWRQKLQQQPLSSSSSSVWNSLQTRSLDFAINVECTSVSLSPSGNFLWAGFSDGTLRVYDVGGGFGIQQDSVSASRQKSHMLVASKWCQSFGAVACQIHARGVHTDLLTHAEIAGDYVFAGVQRGAVELYAVHIRDLELAAMQRPGAKRKNILDYLQVHVHSDAKLKGFGACCALRNTKRPAYLLLTGKGIKNIHIWKFQPPLCVGEEAIWEQIYDTQTNGNTINLLNFYRSPQGQLLAVSKSDSQKLRLWDMSNEEEEQQEQDERPKRPAYQDVANSQAALGIAGGFCVCGGPTMYNQLSIVSLDQPKNAYNHTELALPGLLVAGGGSSRRQRRGDLKQVVRVATLAQDASHALLELDDGSMVHYTGDGSNTEASSRQQDQQQFPKLTLVTPATTGIPSLPADFWRRTLCLANLSGTVVAAVSMYNPNTQKGTLVVRALQPLAVISSPDAADAQALKCMQAPPSPQRLQLVLETPSSVVEDKEKPLIKKKKLLLETPSSVENEKPIKKKKAWSIESMIQNKVIPMSPLKKKRKDSPTENDIQRSSKVVVPMCSAENKTKPARYYSPTEKVETPGDDGNKEKLVLKKKKKKARSMGTMIQKGIPMLSSSPVEPTEMQQSKVINLMSVEKTTKDARYSSSTEKQFNKKPQAIPMSVEKSIIKPNKDRYLLTEKLKKVLKGIPMSAEKSNRFDDDETSAMSSPLSSSSEKVVPTNKSSSAKKFKAIPMSVEKSIIKPNKYRYLSTEKLKKLLKVIPMSAEKSNRFDDDETSAMSSPLSSSSEKVVTTNKSSSAKKFKAIPMSVERSNRLDDDETSAMSMSCEKVVPTTKSSIAKPIAASSDEDDKSFATATNKTNHEELAQVSPEQQKNHLSLPTGPAAAPIGAITKFLLPANRVLHQRNESEYEHHQAAIQVVETKKLLSPVVPRKKRKKDDCHAAASFTTPDKEQERVSVGGSSITTKPPPSAKVETVEKAQKNEEEKEESSASEKTKNADPSVPKAPQATADVENKSDLLRKKEKKLRKKMMKLKRLEAKFSQSTSKSDNDNAPSVSVKESKKQLKPTPSAREPLADNTMTKLKKQKDGNILKKTAGPSKLKETSSSGTDQQREMENKESSKPLQGKKRSREKNIELVTTPIVSDKKRPLPNGEKHSEANIASILCDLKSPTSDKTYGRTGEIDDSVTTSKSSSRTQDVTLTREEIMAERIVSQYKRLRMYLNSLPSNLNILNRHQQKPRLSSLDLESSQEQQRTGLAKQHRSSHEMIQKRVLQGAETTLRLLMDSCISVEEARADLKATIGSYQEVLHDTLKRQELEASTLAAQQTYARRGLEAPVTKVAFPFHAAFRKVEDIYEAIEPPRRPPGRPRSAAPGILQ